jgi:SNF2 family DNA or RNA helicase
MIILHATIHDRRFFLWGETPAAKNPGVAARHGRKPKGLRPPPYPYDAGTERLVLALADAVTGFKPGKKRFQQVTVWLPTQENTPLPSSPLIAAPPESSAKTVLAPWTITALPLMPGETVELLCAAMGKQTFAAGLVIGEDLAFWAQVLRFAGALVARQQYLPYLEIVEGRYRACWEPVVTGQDADQLAALSKRMPPAARAMAEPEATSPPETPAIEMLKPFFREMVDHLVRSALEQSSALASPPRSLPVQRLSRQAVREPADFFDSLHDYWLHSLRTGGGMMEGRETDLAQLAAQVQEWQRPVSVSTASPFRLCFRLEEPTESGATAKVRTSRATKDLPSIHPRVGMWFLRYLLQAADDPSLLIPARDTWKTEWLKGSLRKGPDCDLREYLLSSLGQAAGICPRIEGSLKTTAPDGYELDATGAHEFLTSKSMALEQAGFGVLLPAWWTRIGTKRQLTIRANVKSPKMQGGGRLSLDEIVQFDWEIALGDEKLSLQELRALARLKAPLVKVRGQWVEMTAQEIRAALEFWEKKGAGSASVREIIQMSLGALKPVGEIEFKGVTASGWIGEMLKRLEGSGALEELPAPDGFVGTLRSYQLRGYSWLRFLRQWGLGACLADDMGLGKTIQTLALIQRDWKSNGRRPVLLVCPTSVVNNWQKEAGRFTPDLPVMIHHGIERKKDAAFDQAAREQAIVVSSYTLLHRDFEHLQKVDWAGIILDEAQNIKNPETKQARAARSLAADYRIALTGTPVENNVGDLWSIMEFLNPGFLGNQAQFKRNFFIPIQAGRDPEAMERLKRVTGPLILRRLKTDKAIISDLPEKLEMKVFCTLTKEQASLYAAVVKEAEKALDSSEGIQRKGVILGTLSKLKQVCNHPVQFLGDNSAIGGRSGKLARLSEMLDEVVEVGDRALVFTQFAEMGEILKRHLQEIFGREIFFLHGGIPKTQRDRMVDRFQAEEGGPAIFILSLKAGGTGLNLTGANHVFHFDRWWNPAVENQATDRAFRIGQMRNVQVHKFLCAGTLEEKIDEMIERKKEVAEKVVGIGEGWLTEMSNAELKDLFALRKEAVGE